MSKGKKKNDHHKKYDRAEQRNHFFEMLKSLCKALGRPEVYQMLPQRQLDLLYMARELPFKIIAAPGEQIPDEILKGMRILLPHALGNGKVPLLKDGPMISLDEAIFPVSTVFKGYLHWLKDSEFRAAVDVKKALEPFWSFDEDSEIADQQLELAHDILAFFTSDLNSRLYWVELKKNRRRYDPFGTENWLLVHSHVPEKRNFSFDGVSRPSIKVCWGSTSMGRVISIPIKPDSHGLSGACFDQPLDIYIQPHALRRLSERLDCVNPSLRQLNLFASTIDVHGWRQTDGSFLIEYRLDGSKAGYLVASILDNALVIRTFLFITNSGTPEGKKLQEISGIRRLDKEFLAIDKLSTFIASDIKSNKELESLFLEAGCESLLDLRDNTKGMTGKEDMVSALPMLMKYFGVGAKEDFLAPDPIEKLRARFTTAS